MNNKSALRTFGNSLYIKYVTSIPCVSLSDAFDMPVSHVQATLKYALRHNGFLSTVDGSDLTAGCVADYNDAFDQSTVTQVCESSSGAKVNHR